MVVVVKPETWGGCREHVPVEPVRTPTKQGPNAAGQNGLPLNRRFQKLNGLSGVLDKIAALPHSVPTSIIKIMDTTTSPTTSALEWYQTQLVNDSLAAGPLNFCSFTLKSGRCDQLMFA